MLGLQQKTQKQNQIKKVKRNVKCLGSKWTNHAFSYLFKLSKCVFRNKTQWVFKKYSGSMISGLITGFLDWTPSEIHATYPTMPKAQLFGCGQSVFWQKTQIEGYELQLQQFKNQFQRTMAYYFYLNSPLTSFQPIEQWQGYYSSLYRSSEEFPNSPLYAIPWPKNEFFQLKEQNLAIVSTMLPQEHQNSSQIKRLYVKTPKKRTQKTLEKQIMSAKKNSQSNIVNQFYSFYSSPQKSAKIVQSCCRLMGKIPEHFQQILSLFYTSIKLINLRRGRKYVNAAMFLKFYSPKQLSSYLPEMVSRLQSCGVLNMEQLCQIFRRCAQHFLRSVGISAILTSKRISRVSKGEHLRKRRKFLRTRVQL